MTLQSGWSCNARGGHHRGDRPFDSLGKNGGLLRAGDKRQDIGTRRGWCRCPWSERADGAGTDLAAKQRRVLSNRRQRERLLARARPRRGQRLVETDVAVRADAEQLHVYATAAADQFLIVLALCCKIACRAIRQVRVAPVNVDPAEKMPVHVVAVRMRILGQEADIFVEVKRAAKGEIEPLAPMQFGQMPVNLLHRSAGGQAKRERRLRLQTPCNQARHEQRGLFRRRLNDDFHDERPETLNRRGGTPRNRPPPAGAQFISDNRATSSTSRRGRSRAVIAAVHAFAKDELVVVAFLVKALAMALLAWPRAELVDDVVRAVLLEDADRLLGGCGPARDTCRRRGCS